MVPRSIMAALLQSVFRLLVRGVAGKGVLEVERKFAITSAEAEGLPLKLRELGFTPAGSVFMSDTFLPASVKGEMLRVRDELAGNSRRCVLTHKVWVATADGGKERRERERHVGPLMRAFLLVFGKAAAGRKLAGFSKERSLFSGHGQNEGITVTIDKVSGLGEFSGYYLEVEVLVPQDADPKVARARIYEVASLVLGSDGRHEEAKSYMDMLEASRK